MAEGVCLKKEIETDECDVKKVEIKQEIESGGEEYEDISTETNYTCPVCHAVFGSCESLQLHISIHKGDEKKASLQGGNVQVKTETDEVQDERSQSPSQSDDSEDSDYANIKTHKAKRRRKTSAKSKILACDQCEYATTHWSNLRTHKRKHTGEKPYACDVCDYRSAQLVHLREHMYIHQEVEAQIPCPKCDQVFSRPHSLRRHLRRHRTENLYECKYCDHKSLGPRLLKDHMKEHMPGYKCPECIYTGKTMLQLKRHLVLHHTTNKAYKCEFCDYRTHNSNHLTTHIRVHTKEKPYKCSQCSYASTQKNHLMTHLRSHSGEKPYGCEYCSYTSTQATHVKAHRRIHTGERPYKCNESEYATKTATELRKHRLRHHPKEGDPVKALLTCNMCDYKCKVPRQLRQHRARRHPEDSNGNVKEAVSKEIPMLKTLVTLPIEIEMPLPMIVKKEIIEEQADDSISC